MWIDYSLRWNPAEYGGIKVVRIPAPEVWRPDIILYNNVRKLDSLFKTLQSFRILVNKSNCESRNLNLY